MALWSCTKHSTNSCPDAPNGNCQDANDGGGIDTPLPIDAYYCTNSAPCMDSDKPACDLDNGQCYACTAMNTGACANTTPVCGSNNTCEPCSEHSQCPQDVCLTSGACDDGTDVAYVQGSGGSASAGSGSACTFAAPCGTFADALATGRPIIKVAGTLDEAVSIGSGSVTIYADPGATLKGATAGPALKVSGTGTAVTVYDLTITSAVNDPASIGVVIPSASGAPMVMLIGVTVSDNPGGGINVGGGTVEVERSTVANNAGVGISATNGTLTVQQSSIAGNIGGGLSLTNTAFTIVNNFITKNGSSTATLFGGVTLAATAAGARQFDFNTVGDNVAEPAFANGIICAADASFVLDSNIIYSSLGSASQGQFNNQGNCNAVYSDVGGSAVTAGSGNIDADPAFVSEGTSPDFHLKSTSPCIDAADPAATLSTDFDGQTRPNGTVRDIGADEYYAGSGG